LTTENNLSPTLVEREQLEVLQEHPIDASYNLPLLQSIDGQGNTGNSFTV